MNCARTMVIMPQPIRVLELRAADGPGGGPEKTILRGAAQADRSQFEVTVCYLRRAQDAQFDMARRASEVSVEFIDISERRAVDLSAWSYLRTIVRERKIHLVHSHDYKSNLLALWLASRENVVPLSTAHGWTGNSMRERWLYYPLERRLLLGRFPRVIAVSSEIRESMISAGIRPERIEVVLNGIDHERCRRNPHLLSASRAQFGVGRQSVVLGAVGRLEPQKRFDLLLTAFAQVARQDPRLELLIAGEGSQRGMLQDQATKLGIGDRCRLLGHVADMHSFYHVLNLLVQSSDYEGTSNVVLEAMAYEVPVIATSVGGTGELIRDGSEGWIVPPGDYQGLAAAIGRVVEDPLALANCAFAARKRIDHDLSFRERMRKVERIYRELVGNGRNMRNAISDRALCST